MPKLFFPADFGGHADATLAAHAFLHHRISTARLSAQCSQILPLYDVHDP